MASTDQKKNLFALEIKSLSENNCSLFWNVINGWRIAELLKPSINGTYLFLKNQEEYQKEQLSSNIPLNCGDIIVINNKEFLVKNYWIKNLFEFKLN